MFATVGEIGIFTKCDFPAGQCPQCRGNTVLLGTTNEWKNWCKDCDIRFSDKGEIYGREEESQKIAKKAYTYSGPGFAILSHKPIKVERVTKKWGNGTLTRWEFK